MLSRLKTFILGGLFPYFCLGCSKLNQDSYLCLDCLNKLELFNAFLCPVCLKRLPLPEIGKIAVKNLKIQACQNCLAKNNLLALAAVLDYRNKSVRNLILNFKYRFIKSLADDFSKIMLFYLERTKLDFSDFIITAVPLYKKRQAWRGFNQSELLAKNLAKALNLSFDFKSLKRIKNTKSQVEIPPELRKQNVQNAFLAGGSFIGKNILLIDDIYTTGATMQAATQTLKKVGAKKVFGLVLAKG